MPTRSARISRWIRIPRIRSGNDPSKARIQIERPAVTVKAARGAGLLTSRALNRPLREALSRRQEPLPIADRVAEAGVAPMPMEEIDVDVR